MDRKTDGRRWQRRREDAGIEQEDAAKQAGISRVSLSRYESGVRAMPKEVRERLGEIYGAAPVARETGNDFDFATFYDPTITPEPSTWALLAVGLVAVGAVRRRRFS